MGRDGSSFRSRLSPEVSRGFDRDDFKVDQIIPAADPRLEQFRIGCFHDLKAPNAGRLHPAGVIDEAFGQPSTSPLEPFADRPGIAIFKVLDDHE
jgi:hypothetical protein